MFNKSITVIACGLMLTACAKNETKETVMDFTDNVKVALENGGKIDLNALKWTREPGGFEVKGDTILITTAPHTDLWQRTYYHFQNDNAPVLQMQTREKFFSFVVKTDFTQSHQRFDQCGIVMYLNSENWVKGSFGRVRERGIPAPRQRCDQQGLFRLGNYRYPRRCQDDVVSLLASRR